MGTALGTTASSALEIITAYSASNQQIPAVATEDAPAWHVVGAFYLPLDYEDAQLEAIGSVSDSEELVMSLRLFDLDTVEAVSGSDVRFTSLADVRAVSGLIALTGGHRYQVQVQVVGDSGADFYGVVRTASLI